MSKRPLIEAEIKEPEPRYFTNGLFTISMGIAPYGRPKSGVYPSSVSLLFRMGDARSHIGYDLTWDDAEKLHADLGRALRDRARYKRAFRKAALRQTPIG